MTLRVREAETQDLASIVDLVGQLGYPSDERSVARRLERLSADPRSWVYVAVEGEDVVGLAAVHVMSILERDDPIARITAMVVAERARGSGAGRALLERLDDVARKEGCDRIDLTTRYEREGAAAFYRRMGFEDTSLRFVKDLD
ncbi:MAG TPA: GNAT family N-acetyltransferase [Solirubrobacterales bacterium]